jgi:hypothetical protein
MHGHSCAFQLAHWNGFLESGDVPGLDSGLLLRGVDGRKGSSIESARTPLQRDFPILNHYNFRFFG